MILVFLAVTSCTTKESELDTDQIKVALRAVGNQLLHSQNDTTSLVLPIVKKSPFLFEVSFEKPITFDPADLNQITASVFEIANLPDNYLVEVLKCDDEEVAYSYKVASQSEKNIIPCGGRIIPIGCYTLQVKFANTTTLSTNNILFYR